MMSYYTVDFDEDFNDLEWEEPEFAYAWPGRHRVPRTSWSSVQASLAEANDTAQKIAVGALQTLPHALQGAAAGAKFGPYGAVIGGLAGGALGLAQAGQKTVGSSDKRAMQPLTLEPQSSASPGASPGAARLLSVLYRPEVLQALVMMLMGNSGHSHVKVGDTPVPVGAFANMLGSLAGQAAAEYHTARPQYSEDVPTYLFDSDGELFCDPAVPEERAAVLLHLLSQTAT
ncbi:MAG: hypothetical protein L0332_07025 [Chloroflexi bacterium]|nr:hypothetical protein [Chloroflexota bacterium]MCI0579170.1 hypothetical protein [Chloroflexota bacterium]MCI0647951.1 hypothetical protein [Chloroflexota bacterium]MCI0726461.1 hypothetical protein [Chloroflexota bacterium]